MPWRCRSTRQQPSFGSSPTCSVFSVMKSLLNVHIHLLAVASDCVNPSFSLAFLCTADSRRDHAEQPFIPINYILLSRDVAMKLSIFSLCGSSFLCSLASRALDHTCPSGAHRATSPLSVGAERCSTPGDRRRPVSYDR